jgi:hypothetical protein
MMFGFCSSDPNHPKLVQWAKPWTNHQLAEVSAVPETGHEKLTVENPSSRFDPSKVNLDEVRQFASYMIASSMLGGGNDVGTPGKTELNTNEERPAGVDIPAGPDETSNLLLGGLGGGTVPGESHEAAGAYAGLEASVFMAGTGPDNPVLGTDDIVGDFVIGASSSGQDIDLDLGSLFGDNNPVDSEFLYRDIFELVVTTD